AAQAQSELRRQLQELDDAGELTVSTGMASFAGSLEVVVSGADGQEVDEASKDVLAAVQDVEGATDVTSNLAADLPTVQVEEDKGSAAVLGLTEAQIGQAVQAALQGSTLGGLNTDGGRQDIVMRMGDKPATVSVLEDLALPGPAGSVPLSEVAEVSVQQQPVEVHRTDGPRR